MFTMTGIDTEKLKPHSKRAASMASKREVPISDILSMGNWSNESAWQKHYNKNFSVAEKYQKVVLGAFN